MPLDPQIQTILKQIEKAGLPEFWQLSPTQARAQFKQTAPVLDARPISLHHVENLTIPGPVADIPIRRYYPRKDELLPVLVWFHGGGFVVGGLDSYDAICRKLCQLSDCIVLSVDYRLAPEHKFPAAVEDCFAALQWTLQNASDFGGDPNRIAVAGDSAGGNLATVCSILARDAKLNAPIFQLLVYPGTAPYPDSESHQRFAEGHVLTRKSILWFYDHYLNHPTDAKDFRFAPLVATDLANLPPALVIVADHDPLYDEGCSYAERLRAAGNTVELSNYPGMVHAFYSMSGSVDAAKQAIQQSAQALKHAFGTT